MTIPLAILVALGSPPPSVCDTRVLVAALGSPVCSGREAAQQALRWRVASYPDERWTLYDALDSPDREVRWRALVAIRAAWPCPHCYGRGGRWYPTDSWVSCSHCKGWGCDDHYRREICGEPRVAGKLKEID
jgi:hypothetical protein